MAVREPAELTTLKVAGREYWKTRNGKWRDGVLSDSVMECGESECHMLDRIRELEKEKAAILYDIRMAFGDSLPLIKRLEL